MNNKNLKKNFIWNLFGLSCYTLTSLFFLVIVTRINGLKDAGIFTYSFSLCCLFYYISIYYTRTSQIANTKNYNFNKFLSLRIFYSFISLVLIIIFSILSKFSLYKILIILLLMIMKIVESLTDCFYGYLHQKDNLFQVGISLTVRSIIGIASFFIIDYISHNLFLSIISIIIIYILVFVLYDYKLFKINFTDEIILDFSSVFDMSRLFFSLFAFTFLSNLICSIQKLILTYYVSDEIQTLFGILIMPATLLSLISSYLLNPFINDFVKAKDENNIKKFNLMMFKVMLVLFGCGVIVIFGASLFGVPILNFIYSVDVSIYKLDLIFIILGSIFWGLSIIYSNCLTIYNKNNAQLYIYMTVTIVSVFLSIYNIKKCGINGASRTYFLTFFLLFILYTIYYIFNVKRTRKEIK